MRSREVIIGVAGLIAGLAIGFFAANSLNRQGLAQPQSSSSGSSASVAAPGPANGVQADVSETLARAENDPQNFAAQMRAGDMYAQIGRFDRAIEFYKRGVVVNPSNFQANVVLANALFDSQKFDEAEDYYGKALQLEPDNLNARTDLAATFVERPQPDYDKAIAELRRVRLKDPTHEPSLYYLGIATLRKGDKESAVAALAELEKLNPASALVPKLRQNIESR